MSDDGHEHRESSRKLLFELQTLVGIADMAGFDAQAVKELIRKANISSRLGTSDSVKEMLGYLNEGRNLIETIVSESFTKRLLDMRKDIEKKRSQIPQGHVILTSYNIAVNSLKRKDYDTTLKNMLKCKKELEGIALHGLDGEYTRVFAEEAIPCFSCGGNVKAGFATIRCNCGKTYHETCAQREGRCGCGQRFSREALPDEGITPEV